MPIHLGPITRREFLARCAGAGAVLAFGRDLAADESPAKADPNSFALLSDTHIMADPKRKTRGVSTAARFAQVGRELTGLKTRPAGIIHTGDCAHTKGLVGEYVQFARILATVTRAKIPVHLGLGNHDHRENFYRVLKQHRPRQALVAGRHVAVIESPRANWFLLDSLDRPNFTPGLLGAAQIGWLAKALDARADRPAIVLAHHDPQFGRRVGVGLRDTDALFDVLAKRRHVKAYVYGHRHQWNHSRRDGLHLINVPATGYPFGRGQPCGWVHAQLAADGMTLTLHSVDPKHKADGQKVTCPWRS